MIRWNIRNKILSSGIVGLLVIVGVIAYFYDVTKDRFEANSERLLGLVTTSWQRLPPCS